MLLKETINRVSTDELTIFPSFFVRFVDRKGKIAQYSLEAWKILSQLFVTLSQTGIAYTGLMHIFATFCYTHSHTHTDTDTRTHTGGGGWEQSAYRTRWDRKYIDI
jgi:hypothetical protein